MKGEIFKQDDAKNLEHEGKLKGLKHWEKY